MKYRQILLDFDGVVCDSNSIKGANILRAAEAVVGTETALKFHGYFTANNGVPRDIKINHFFPNRQVADSILENYERLNSNLDDATLVPGIDAFLEINKSAEIIVVSGGVEHEINSYLQKKGLKNYISRVLCGPATKEMNLKTIEIDDSCVFFGDSKHDYEVALEFSVDFVFIYGYTQFTEWSTYKFSENVLKFKDFNHLIQITYGKN